MQNSEQLNSYSFIMKDIMKKKHLLSYFCMLSTMKGALNLPL